MRAVTIDDDHNMHLLLANALELVAPDVELVGKASNVTKGVALIKEQKPDLLFLDIEMPDGTGFDLLEQIDFANYLIIFISGHGEYGRMALDFEALAYLDKPLLPEDLAKAIHRARRRHELRTYEERMSDLSRALYNFQHQQRPDRLTVSNAEGLHFIPIEDIVYFQGERDLVTVVCQDGRKISKSTRLKYYCESFDDYDRFIQISKNYLINLDCLSSIGTGPVLNMINGDVIEVGYPAVQKIKSLLD